MVHKEAKARIKINKLLEQAGWRFFDDKNGRANIQLELNAKISQTQFDAFGENFESSQNGYVDFLLLNEKGQPLQCLGSQIARSSPATSKKSQSASPASGENRPAMGQTSRARITKAARAKIGPIFPYVITDNQVK
ncbi:MAG: hypothetical protein IPM39_29110 [Chloroflexi bacterium]|nr:hypothetical protein [Chloroflexota bacterium]